MGKDLLKVYKALLFLGAGSVIHAVADNQDFRRYGGLRSFLPLTYSVMLIASLSLVAFPFMTGFYSKDFILESAFGQYYFSSTVVYIIATIGAMFTTLYSVKVLYLTFLTNPNGPLINYKQAHEGDIFMSLPAWWCGKSLARVKLPNSGKLLKLKKAFTKKIYLYIFLLKHLIPSYIWKYKSGWSNYSGKVTSQKMIEREMEYRGSKSVTDSNKPTNQEPDIVKEQRVDGSWYKRNYFVFKVYSNGCWKILSNQNPFLANIYTDFSTSLKRGISSISIKKPTLHP